MSETDDVVTVTAYVDNPAMFPCSPGTRDTWVRHVVPLDTPLGDRQVVDGACLTAQAARCRYAPR